MFNNVIVLKENLIPYISQIKKPLKEEEIVFLSDSREDNTIKILKSFNIRN